MTYLAKETMTKKLKKVKTKSEDIKSVDKPLEDNKDKPESKDINGGKKLLGKDLKQKLVAENAYITSMLNLVIFPKRADSDDDDVTMGRGGKKMISSKDGAKSVNELRERLKAKLESLQSGKGPGKNKKNKLSKEEKKAKLKEELRLKSKLAKINSTSKPLTTNGLSAKPVYNSEGKMVFSKFDLSNGGFGGNKSKKQDPKLALQTIQKHKDKVKKLQAQGETARVNEIEESSAWSKALEKSEGAKIKDDEGLLKKSIKKQEQRKKSSGKKWEARKEGEEKRKNAKQQKRNDNINKRKQDKKDKKMKKMVKKGRIPGFR